MEYDQEDFLADANQGATQGSDYVEDINKGNIADELTTYTTNLIDYINDNLPDANLADVIGGKSITPVDDSALPPDSLPYTVVGQEDDTFDIDNVPDVYRTSLRILHRGIDKTFFSSDIYGRRLTLRYNGSNQPEIVLDGTVKATGNATTPGQVNNLILSVDHPYDVDDFDATTTLKVTSGGFYQIVNGWGNTGTKILEKHRGALEQYLHDGLAGNSEEVLGESFALAGFTWLAQTSRMRSLAMAHEIGSSCTLIYTSPYIDMPLGHLGVYEYGYGDPNGMFLAIASHASAYEHEMIRQLQDCNAVSTVELLEIANDRTTYDKIFEADSSNWSSIQSQLQSYSQDEKDQVSGYVDGGFDVHLPQYGDLSKDDWTGIGFQAFLSDANCLTAGYVIGPGYKGGCATGDNDPLSPSEVFDRSYVSAVGNDGAYRTGSTDLTIGNGGLPFGLSFGRQYNSQRRLEDGPLGLGWTHNFDITAKVRSDSFQVLGEDSPIDAAAHMVTLYITSDILNDDYELLNNTVVAALCETWLMDQMMDNLVTIKQGAGKQQFVKVLDSSDPNGVYNAPLGTAMKLVVEGDGTFLLKNTSGKFSDFNSNGLLTQWSDTHGNVIDFTYTSGKLTQVASKIGGTTVSRSLSLTYSGDHISTVTDSASRSISYTYDANELIEYTNPDGNDITYDYDDANDGQLTEIFSPVDQVNPFLTNVYDSLGRVKQRIDANDCTWDLYFAYYRAETLGPAQTDPNTDPLTTARFSTVLWANEYGRPIRVLDKLGREATTEYDGHQRVKRVVKPSRASVEYSYDPNHHVIQKFSKVKPNSPPTDPNLLKKNEYDSYENSSGRWFTNVTKYIDPNSSEVIYEYDYDDPNSGTEVGNLMKVTYPQVNAPWDTNTPVVQFTYNTYGQLETKTDAEGMVTKFEYYSAANGAGLKKTIVDYGDPNHLNITTELTYDNVGNVATTKDPRGNITQNLYHDSRLLKKTTAPSPFSYVTDYKYYDDGKLKHTKRVIGQETIYLQSVTYNSRGQKATVKGPYVDGNDLGVNYTQYAYDALGRLSKVTDAESNVTETRYYPDGQVWKIIDAEGHDTITKTYDPNGYLQKVKDAEGNVTEYEYNGFGALK
ncbi:MAG: RHS repeat domain-containing protein, partial [Planctomycetota bacterium]